jgi:chemotaxis protein methyltransferase CheR
MAITPAEFAYIRDFVKRRSALMLEAGKEYLVESRLEALARQEGFASLSRLIQTLRSSPASDLQRLVVEAMTTNETSFFRDIRVFDMFKRRIVPDLVERRGAARAISVWCAASSYGQEPYSIAMTLKEHRPALGEWEITLIASDISREMVAKSRAGQFSQADVNRGLPASMLVKYFEQHGRAWHIRNELRAMIRCWEINLATDWPVLPRMDVIFMRNVLIYFDIETKKKILAKVSRLLRADGYLILGGAETTTNLDDTFEAVTLDGATCFRLKRQ